MAGRLSISERLNAWPALVHEDPAPMVDYVNRLVQVGASTPWTSPSRPAGGNIVLYVTPRGLRTPTFRRQGVTFEVHYRLLDSDVVVESADPRRAIVAFGEAVYEAAVETAGWPADVIGSRCDGWRMSMAPPAAVRGRDQ
ncbi:DUF5996 family protein [Streptomyces sp. NPDC127172]|uniref:DUF5996 family protein n=1 Tax=Streptomyces sp. NPDC127172 TaxID=3345382 RepID=UPI00364546BC